MIQIFPKYTVSINLRKFGFSVFGSFGPAAQELLDLICRRYRIHACVAEWEAHAWVHRRLSFGVAGQLLILTLVTLLLTLSSMLFPFGHDALALVVTITVRKSIMEITSRYPIALFMLVMQKTSKCDLTCLDYRITYQLSLANITRSTFWA